jgi:hypothetical protein
MGSVGILFSNEPKIGLVDCGKRFPKSDKSFLEAENGCSQNVYNPGFRK